MYVTMNGSKNVKLPTRNWRECCSLEMLKLIDIGIMGLHN